MTMWAYHVDSLCRRYPWLDSVHVTRIRRSRRRRLWVKSWLTKLWDVRGACRWRCWYSWAGSFSTSWQNVNTFQHRSLECHDNVTHLEKYLQWNFLMQTTLKYDYYKIVKKVFSFLFPVFSQHDTNFKLNKNNYLQRPSCKAAAIHVQVGVDFKFN